MCNLRALTAEESRLRVRRSPPRTLFAKACRDFRSRDDQAFSGTFVTVRPTFATHPARPSGVSFFPLNSPARLRRFRRSRSTIYFPRAAAQIGCIKRPRNRGVEREREREKAANARHTRIPTRVTETTPPSPDRDSLRPSRVEYSRLPSNGHSMESGIDRSRCELAPSVFLRSEVDLAR